MAYLSTYSAFLELPGELRNRIYHFAIEYGTSYMKQCSVTASEVTSLYLSSTETSRQFFKLAHVSRQVRCETLPLYQAYGRVIVHHQDVDSFYLTFLASRLISFKIAVDVDTQKSYHEVDLMPIVHVLQDSPTTGIDIVEFKRHGPVESLAELKVATLEGISACINNSRFREYIMGATHKLTTVDRQLRLQMKDDHIEPWMLIWNDDAGDYADEYGAMTLLQGSQWLEKTGLDMKLFFENVWFDL